jgi:hypothetical protein
MKTHSLYITLLVGFASVVAPAYATVLQFENVGLQMAKELSGLQSIKDYGDNVIGDSTGGFKDSFAKGNGWTPNVAVDFSAGPDIKTVSSWRDGWDSGDGANYLLDGDDGEPYYYWYRFAPSGGAGVKVNALDLDGVGEHKNRIDWRIYAGSKTGRVLASGTTGAFSGDKLNLDLGMDMPHFGVVVLELVHTGTRCSVAVDNLNFDEAPPSDNAEIVKVGRRKQLLVDDYAIAQMSNLKRELGRTTKLNGGKPLLVRDRPWEQTCMFYGTALHDGAKFQMWYRTGGESGPLGYAESKDGLSWVKPNLGLVEMNGSKQNNIVDKKLGLAYAFSCFIDPHETDPAHKYKCCWGHPRKIRACIGHSPDGLRWTPYNNGDPVTGRAADTHSQLLWDEDAKVYRLFTRTDYQRQLRAEMEVRGHRVMTNPDVKKSPTAWKLGRNWYFKREPKEYRRRQVYSMTDWIHHGVHFALITLYEFPQDMSEGPLDLNKRHERDVLNFYIATSRDAENWDFQWVYASQPIVQRGPNGSFDKDMILPPANIITHQDRHWIYYGGANERHGASKREYGIGGATLRLDGFVALTAGAKPGSALTKPFVFVGDRLEVNADARGGNLRVEVLDARGNPLKGYVSQPITTDALRTVPKWQEVSDLAKLKGQTVRLKFTLKNAKLYAFQVR